MTAGNGDDVTFSSLGCGNPTSSRARLDEDAWTVELATVADTERLGAALAERLKAGDLVVLSGPLGAGKTALARGIGAGLGVRGPVTSPTFVIARVHRGPRVPMVHVDAYRLDGLGELDALDLDTDLAGAVVVVEWGEGLVERLAERHLLVRLLRRDDESRVAHGRWRAAATNAAGDAATNIAGDVAGDAATNVAADAAGGCA